MTNLLDYAEVRSIKNSNGSSLPYVSGKEPLERSKLLETTEIFSNIHAEAAVAGQTATPAADADVDHHYTCFVHAPAQPGFGSGKRLIELDGVRNGPVDHGSSEDLLKV